MSGWKGNQMSTSSFQIYIPRDAAALSVGAERVVKAMQDEAKKRGIAIEIIRNGSRGMLWLEPLVEVATAKGRVAYGPVATKAARTHLAMALQKTLRFSKIRNASLSSVWA